MKEVIILGTGITHQLCPYACETWGCNGAYTAEYNTPQAKDIFRMDKLFLTDYLFDEVGVMKWDIDAINSLITRHRCQIISLHPMKIVETKLNCSPYPFKRISTKFRTQYFTNTICYMIAYAVDKGYKKIRLYGIDMRAKIEYIMEKAGLEFWLGIACAYGCEIEVCEGSSVMALPKGVPYGHKVKLDLKVIDPYKIL